MKILWGFVCGIFFLPCGVFSFTFQFQNTDSSKTYRVFSASLQNLEQSEGIPRASFEQAYEAFLRTQNGDPSKKELFLQGEYHYSQRIFRSKEAFQAVNQDKIYQSYFSRDEQGHLKSLSENNFYPSIRSVPVFPKEDIPLEGIWDDEGAEYQDFSLLGYEKPFQVPFKSKYQYIGDEVATKEDWENLMNRYSQYDFSIRQEVQKFSESLKREVKEGESLAVIHVYYAVDYRAEDHPGQTRDMQNANGNPVIRATGFYNGIVFWNKKNQEEIGNIGEYDFHYTWANNEKRHWSGKEYGIVQILKKDEKEIDSLAKEVKNSSQLLEVEKQKQGIKVILGDLLFEFNKTSLRPSVKETLLHMVKVLSENPNSALHITGYSDDIGTALAKEKIANGRAKTVANFFLEHGIAPSRVSYRGNSDRNPRYPNTSDSNRQKNRRVEIDVITE